MPYRIVAVTTVALALGLAACDQAGQEQAQTPNRSGEQQQQQPSNPSAQPTPPDQRATPPSEQAPTTPPPGGSGSGNQ